ncbi:MAG: TCR/Tet family MFS transporter [Gemmatimonadaceae bacterium]|nr:TCR/Tet family MFS transporter [Gemmatimonadaceae bacterium]
MRHRAPALGFILVTLLIDVAGLGIIIPVMPRLITGLTGQPISDAARWGGWMTFAYAAMQFLCAPIMGGLSDRFGRRPVLLASLFGFGIDYLFMAFAPTIWWLFLSRVIAGAMGASFTTAAAYIADVSPPEKRAQNFGMIGAVFGLGFILGPLLGGMLGGLGPRVPFMASAGLTLVNWLFGYFVLPESLKPEHRRAFDWSRANPLGSLMGIKRHPVVVGLVGSLVLVQIAAHAVQSNWSYYTIEKFHWSERTIGASLAVVGLGIGLVQGGLIRVIIPRLGQRRSVYVGLALYSIGFFLYAAATSTWQMFAFTFVYCLGGIAGPAIQGLISGTVPPSEQGELQGALTSIMSLTTIAGPLIMANTFAWFTRPGAPVYFPGAAMTLGGVLALVSAVLARNGLKATTTH